MMTIGDTLYHRTNAPFIAKRDHIKFFEVM